MSVTNNIKKVRTEKHLSQEDLAKAVMCDVKSISRYETGKRSPSLELALRLAAYLKLSTDELFKVEPDGSGIQEKGGPS